MELLYADWVFGYGSLIWNPEIDYEHADLGRVHGYHRAFCINSMQYRGTPEAPGVVLGLTRGGSCIGMAYKLHHANRQQAIEQLYVREMADHVYVPTLVGVTLPDGQRVRALTFAANRSSSAFQDLHEDEILRRLASCCGKRGPNRDYAINTWRSLRAHGVHDARLAGLVRRLQAGGHD